MHIATRTIVGSLLAALSLAAPAQELSLTREVAACMARKKSTDNRCRAMMMTQRLEKARKDVAAAAGQKPVQEQLRLAHALVVDPSYEPSMACPPSGEACVAQAVSRCVKTSAPKASEEKDPEALKSKQAQARERCERAGSEARPAR